MKGPQLAHIGLAPTTKTSRGTRMFEFVVKINGKLFLRSKSRASTVKTAKFNNSLLINNKFNQYWISWIDGIIEIGSGWMVGEEKLLS